MPCLIDKSSRAAYSSASRGGHGPGTRSVPRYPIPIGRQAIPRVAWRDERTTGRVKRHTGVLVEGLRHELQLVAEGLAMHIQVQHVQEREYFDRKFEDTHALIRSSYDHLQQQHDHLQQSQDQLRQRVENLERN